MDIFAYGVNFKNKGAELMMYSIRDRLQQWDTANKIAVDVGVGTFEQRNEAEVYHYLWKRFRKIPYGVDAFNIVAKLIPNFLRDRYKLVLESELDCVMESSGFAYSDQWGEKPTQNMAELCHRWKKQGKKIIFLPQAFGPFTTSGIKHNFSQIVDLADLIFARDQKSYDYISQIANSMNNVKIAPDFTNLLPGLKPKYADRLINRPCIIPNYRMLDKTTANTKNQYLTFIDYCLKYLVDRGLDPFILIHELDDFSLGQQIKQNFVGKIEIVRENNPLYLKGILGDCQLVIGSRFHGLISALSQETPCLGTGWSHKYQELFESYSCPEMLINLQANLDSNINKLEMLVSESSRNNLIQSIKIASERQKALSEAMWHEVAKLLFKYLPA